jgi:hypothetical protein
MAPKRTHFRAKKTENPFEKFANSKKKHEVVNRRVKGEDRNVGRARGKVSSPCDRNFIHGSGNRYPQK